MTSDMWNRPAPPGFQGFREDLPLSVCWRHLPHWRQHGATYFVTFRLADSLPQGKLRELEVIKADWARKHNIPTTLVGERADYQSALRGKELGTDYQSVVQKADLRRSPDHPSLCASRPCASSRWLIRL